MSFVGQKPYPKIPNKKCVQTQIQFGWDIQFEDGLVFRCNIFTTVKYMKIIKKGQTNLKIFLNQIVCGLYMQFWGEQILAFGYCHKLNF